MKLGIVGRPSSGKDTVAKYLVDHYGFTHISTGDFVRAYIAKNNLGDMTRPFLRDTGDALRKENGSDYLMRLALEDEHKRLIISGIRSIGEAETLKATGGKLIAMNVPIEQRYKWAVARKRASDQVSFEEFEEQEKVEESNADINACNVSTVIKMADYTLENFANLDELYKKIDYFIAKIS